MTTVLGNIHAKCNSSPLVSHGLGIPASVRRTAHTCTACVAVGSEGGSRKVGSTMASKLYNAQSPKPSVSANGTKNSIAFGKSTSQRIYPKQHTHKIG